MNIRGLTSIITSFQVKPKDTVARQTSADRDSSSNSGDPGENPRRHLTEEELLRAVEYLKGLSGVVDHNLNVRLERKDGVSLIFIEDSSGKIIRRIPETDIAVLLKSKGFSKGQILDLAL